MTSSFSVRFLLVSSQQNLRARHWVLLHAGKRRADRLIRRTNYLEIEKNYWVDDEQREQRKSSAEIGSVRCACASPFHVDSPEEFFYSSIRNKENLGWTLTFVFDVIFIQFFFCIFILVVSSWRFVYASLSLSLFSSRASFSDAVLFSSSLRWRSESNADITRQMIRGRATTRDILRHSRFSPSTFNA